MQPSHETNPLESLDVLRDEADRTGTPQPEPAADIPDDCTVLPLGTGGSTVTVLPERLWRSSAIHAVQVGDYETWAASCLADNTYDTWVDIDPTVEEMEAMFAEFNRLKGIDPLASRAARRSSQRIQRR